MSWFDFGVSQDELDKMDAEFERKYGKVKRRSEIKEYDELPRDDPDYEDGVGLDDDKDEKFDYSDLED